MAPSEVMGTNYGILNRGETRSDLHSKGVPMAAVKGAGEAGRGEARRLQGAVGEVPGGRQ